MSEFKFQFQYDPTDLKAIRDANGTVVYSPATTMTAWAAGFSIALMILAANGMWAVLLVVVVCALVFILFYVSSLSRKSFADREYRVRTLTLNETGVTEGFGSSLFEKSWSAFEEMLETPRHFLLRHYEKITALPKRVMAEDQLDECRDLIQQQMNPEESQRLSRFEEMFNTNGQFPIYRFRWQPEDTQSLHSARMQRYGEYDVAEVGGVSVAGRFTVMVFLWAGIALATFLLGQMYDLQQQAVRVMSFQVAIIIPFFVAFVWWRYMNVLSRNKTPRIPDEEILVTFNESDLMIGYSQAVARYSWQDIAGFYISKNFIGFQPAGGMVHVIAKRAFGDAQSALNFLEMADQLKGGSSPSCNETDLETDVVETGNPYQAPMSLD